MCVHINRNQALEIGSIIISQRKMSTYTYTVDINHPFIVAFFRFFTSYLSSYLSVRTKVVDSSSCNSNVSWKNPAGDNFQMKRPLMLYCSNIFSHSFLNIRRRICIFRSPESDWLTIHKIYQQYNAQKKTLKNVSQHSVSRKNQFWTYHHCWELIS